jgi:hypothetical protein
MQRDYIILLVALTIMGAGLTDGLVRAFDVSIGTALLPVAAAWALFAYAAYQNMVARPSDSDTSERESAAT